MAAEHTRLPHGTIQRAQIIETAYRIVAFEGVDGLTMRGLAEALGTKPMSLYRHVSSKEDIIDAVMELALEAGLEMAEQDGWREEVIAIFTDFWMRMTLEPGLGAIIVSRPIPSKNMAYTTNRIMKALAVGGFGDLAGRAVDTLLLFTLGAIAYDLSRSTTAREGMQQHDADLPELLQHSESYGERDAKEYFSFGIEAVMRGLEALRGSPADRSPGLPVTHGLGNSMD